MDSTKWSNYSNIGTFVLTIVILLIMVVPLVRSTPADPSPTAQSASETHPRWTRMSVWIMPSILALAVLGAAVLNLAASRQQKKTPPSAAQDEVRETVIEKPPQWFLDIITEDQTRMPQKLMAVKWDPHRAFDGSDPYIDFDVTFVNASVFELNKPETIRGKVKFRNQPLGSLPQLEKSFPMPRGEKTWIKVRQFVTTGMAAEMKLAINTDQITLLDFSEVRIPFTGHCHGLATPSFEWSGPAGVSFKDITAM